MKYSIIIVLSAGATVNPSGSFDFNNGKDTFKYAIPADPYGFRFKAVKKLYDSGACSKFVLVGGAVESIDKIEHFLDKNGQKIPKAETMFYELTNKYNLPPETLICLESTSNTMGNAEKVAEFLKIKNIDNINEIGILTSFFHLPRSIRMFTEEGLRLIPISAESVIYEEEFENIKKYYNTQGLAEIIKSEKNEKSEVRGMGALENDKYISEFI